MIEIGNIRVDSRAVLAPMAGVTDLPFRELCFALGTRLAVSEMISANTTLWSTRKSRQRLAVGRARAPRWVQIAGAEPDMMAAAALQQQAQGADIIDINMGCPAKKVCRKSAGSALMRDEKLVTKILSAVVNAVDVPVTLKIRTGWCPSTRNAIQIARIAEQAGIKLLSVHGRTRACRFNGAAEYDTIAKVVDAVSLPVIANGDIGSPEFASHVMHHTGAIAVMIGRAAQGRPWLCGQIDYWLRTGQHLPAPARAHIGRLMHQHLQALYEFYGEHCGVRIARKHVGWYLSATDDASGARQNFNALTSMSAQLDMINQHFLNELEDEELAA